mgnify:CR=1 FL=1
MPEFKGEVMSCLCQSDIERRTAIDLLQFKLGLEVTNIDVIGSKQLNDSFCGFIKNVIHKEFLVIINGDWSSIGAVPHLESFYFRSVDRLDAAVLFDFTCESDTWSPLEFITCVVIPTWLFL